MAELVQANWIWLVIALVIGIIVAWWIFVASRKTVVTREEHEEASPQAKRNQALIDAPPAAAAQPAPPAIPTPASPGIMSREAVRAPQQATPGASREALAAAEGPAPEGVAPAGGDPVERSAPPAPREPVPGPGPGPGQVDDASPGADDLTRIKGLGPKLQGQLRELGVTSFAQIAAWDEAEIDRVDAQLGRFQGRIRRDNWPEQARLLSAGDEAAYEERFGKLS